MFDQPAMASAFPSYQNWHQGLAGPGMSSGPRPSDRAVTSTRTADDPGGSCQLAPSGKITSKADTSESNSREASTEPAAPRRRLYLPEWKTKQLDKVFQRKAYITGIERTVLASALQMTKEEVRAWFQNKRMNIKRRCLLDGAKNSAHNMKPSRAVSRASGDQQQSASFLWQGFGVNQKYTLLCESDVISSTVAKSPVGALQDMLVQIERNPSVRFFRSVDNYCQSRLSQPDDSPATTSHTVPGN